MTADTTPTETRADRLKHELAQLSAEAGELVAAADRIAECLRDLADPRITLPDLPTLRERLREWAAELEVAAEPLANLWLRTLFDDDEEEDRP